MKKVLIILTAFFLNNTIGNCQNQLFSSGNGQLNAWSVFNFDKETQTQIGTRFIPEISIEYPIDSNLKLDAEFSFNTVGSWLYKDWDYISTYESFAPYRMWVRLSSQRFELRAGLQKINFGSANMLRPLMWFDQMDPRDPLQLTNGVYGILGRYYFKNNSNIWLWSLYGNDALKGWDVIGTDKGKPEFGGRYQFPFLKGELATSFNYRKTNSNNSKINWGHEALMITPEYKIGLDGKWDVGVGLWFESSYSNNHELFGIETITNRLINQLYNNIGIDYTIGIGNGLNVIYEQIIMTTAGYDFAHSTTNTFSGIALNYPFGMFDNISCMVYYNWDNGDFYRFVNYQRSYDNWSFYLMGFWNPNVFGLYSSSFENNLFAGKGLQLMSVYNF